MARSTKSDIQLRSATGEDRAHVEALLVDAGLPLDGLDRAWPHTVVAVDGDVVIGAAGIEPYTHAGLLRSVVVAGNRRGQRLGETLVRHVVARAARAGISDVWLLTFVPEWFDRLGFERNDRAGAPIAMHASAEFSGACPDTAVAMRRTAWRDDALADADAGRPLGPPVFLSLDDAARRHLVGEIEAAPFRLRGAVHGLDGARLDTRYRENGWTVRQVVHHLADAHLNGTHRLRLLLTEDTPTIRPYDERAWAELRDAREAPLEWSLDLFDSLHRRMTLLLRSLGPADFERRFRHPESGDHSLDDWLQLHAWHGAHHTAQIQALRARRGW